MGVVFELLTPVTLPRLSVRHSRLWRRTFCPAPVYHTLGVEDVSRFESRDLLADVRCSHAVLDFLSTTDVGRLVPSEEDAGSEASEWELRERREREEERRADAEELGAEGEQPPLLPPMPSFIASAEED